MKSAWEEVQPKNIYRGAKQRPLKDRGQEALLYLYQPVIGSLATTLYLSLLGEIKWQYGLSEAALHSDLLTDCDFGLQNFYEARLRLEGLGLLRSFCKADPQLGKIFLYELQEPLAPEEFLKDSLLTFLLKEKVSEHKFGQLSQRFLPKAVDSEGYEEVTRRFQEVYDFQQARFSAELEELTEYTQQFAEDPQTTGQSSLDWQLLQDTLKRQGLEKPLTTEEQGEVSLYAVMYGLDEIELCELLAKTADSTTAAVDLKAFKKLVEQLHSKQQPQAETAVPQAAAALSPEDQKTYRYNSLKLEGYSDFDIQIIQETENYPPMTYFEAIKKQKGGFVSVPETWVVRDLINKSGLPSSVINFLIHYIMVVRNASVLNTFDANKFANEWAEKKIHSPEAALKYVREQAELQDAKQKERQNTRKTAGSHRQIRKERVPDWMNKQAIPEAKLTPERQAELDAKLKEFLKEGD